MSLVVVCPGIQRLFLAEKCGKFPVVGDGRQKGCHRTRLIDAHLDDGKFNPALHDPTASVVPRLNSIDKIDGLCIHLPCRQQFAPKRAQTIGASAFQLPPSRGILRVAKIDRELERKNYMATNVKQMMDAANAAVPRITPVQAREMMGTGNTLVVDVRDAPEVDQSGKVAGSVNISRGMLELRADPDSPYHDKSFSKDKTIIVYCASGGRSALAGKVLKDMGYDRVYNLGAFKDWAESGGALG
ncbi:MAG: rhodanese-like domain-containing protein [Steroidobacteraceae bacterium]